MQHLNKINIYDSISDSQSVNSLGFSRSRVCVWIVISRVSCVYVGLVRVVRDPQQRAGEKPRRCPPPGLCQPSRRAQQREQRRGKMGIDAVSFCAAPDARALFAVLGVVTHQQSSFRHSIRRTWLPSPEAGVVTRLVMRGLNASAAVIDEAAQFGDTIFLPSSAHLSKDVGPLLSTWQWLECAVSAWPRAALVGKAEDDVWVHLPGVLESLRAGSAALGNIDLRSMYWGMIETCNTTHRTRHHHYTCSCPPSDGCVCASRLASLLERDLSTTCRLRPCARPIYAL